MTKRGVFVDFVSGYLYPRRNIISDSTGIVGVVRLIHQTLMYKQPTYLIKSQKWRQEHYQSM